MALIAVLQSSSRSIASRLDFWIKKRVIKSVAKTATMISSSTVKPFLWFISLL